MEQLAIEFKALKTAGRSRYRKDQYVICRYNGGNNGDLIVARVTSVRKNGDVLLINMLNDARAVKHEEILSRRNLIVSKKLASYVITAHANALLKGRLQAEARYDARKEAVRISRMVKQSPTRQMSLRVRKLIGDIQRLTEQEFDDFSKTVFCDVLRHYGVQ